MECLPAPVRIRSMAAPRRDHGFRMIVPVVVILLGSCNRIPERGCDKALIVPDGFCAQLFAEDLGPARHVAVSPAGDVYVARWREGSRNGQIIALRDTNGDGRADAREQFGPEAGSGLTISGNALFLGAWGKVYRWWLSGDLLPGVPPEVVGDGIPELEHGARSIAVGPDSALYINVGVASNACERDYARRDLRGDDPCRELGFSGGIWRLLGALLPLDLPHRPDIANRFATGLRHTVALGIDSEDGAVYGAPHGIDHLDRWWPEAGYTARDAAEKPGETLFRIQRGGDYGFPYCMFDPALQRMVESPAYRGTGKSARCTLVASPVAVFAAHSAPLALVVYRGTMFPPRFRGGIFVAMHGSLFRAPLDPTGYSVMFVPRLSDGSFGKPEVFADGLSGRRFPLGGARPRPSGLAVGPDGSLYVADDNGGRLWKIVPVIPD
jgi:glucose/arabinose dehydrogenase